DLAASPSPRPRKFGMSSGPVLPEGRARPSAHALAMWPKVLAPWSPKRSASGAEPRPKESSTPTIARTSFCPFPQCTVCRGRRKYIFGGRGIADGARHGKGRRDRGGGGGR